MDSSILEGLELKDLVEEIKALEADVKISRDKLNEINKPRCLIKSLSEEVEFLRKELNCFQDQKNAKNKEIEAKQLDFLNREIENLNKDISTYLKKNHSVIVKQTADINLLEEITKTEDPSEYKTVLDSLKKIKDENIFIKCSIENYRDLGATLSDVSNVKENIVSAVKLLDDKRNSLSASSEEIQRQLKATRLALEEEQEQTAIICSELATLKSGETQNLFDGTSLFSEVEDKRQEMLSNLKTVANKCYELKTVCFQKENEANKLMKDNAMLELLIKNDTEQKNCEIEVRNASLQRIQDLQTISSSLKLRPENEETIIVSEKDANYSWLHNYLEKYKLDAKLSEERFQNHRKKLMEIQFRHVEAIQRQNETKQQHANLLSKIQEIELKLTTTTVPQTDTHC